MDQRSCLFNSVEGAMDLRLAIDSEEVTVASEALVLGFKLVGKGRKGTIPVLIVPSDKSADEHEVEEAYAAAIEA